MNKRYIFLLFLLLTVVLLSGCEVTPLSEYINNGSSSEIGALKDGNYQGKDYSIDGEQYLALCRVLRENFKKVMVGSILLGVLIYKLFSFDRPVQQFSVFGLGFGIPIFVFVVTYFVCYLYGELYS